MTIEKNYSETTLTLLSKLLGGQNMQNVNIRLWDGRCWPDEAPRQAPLNPVISHVFPRFPGIVRILVLLYLK